MANENLEDLEERQLEEYIERELGKGFSIKTIKKALLNAHHPNAIVEKAIKGVESKKEVSARKPFQIKSANFSLRQVNKKLMMGICLILIILLGGYISYLFIKSHEGQVIPEEEEKTLLEIINENAKIGEEYYDCMALVHDDPGFCNGFENPNRCKDLYYWDMSFFKNESFCDKLSEEKSIICVAFHKKEPTTCSNIKNDSEKNYCLGLVTQNTDYCDGLSDHTWANSWDCKGRNKFILAVKNKDISLCEKSKIGDYNMVEFCKAIILKDDSRCLNFAKEMIED